MQPVSPQREPHGERAVEATLQVESGYIAFDGAVEFTVFDPREEAAAGRILAGNFIALLFDDQLERGSGHISQILTAVGGWQFITAFGIDGPAPCALKARGGLGSLCAGPGRTGAEGDKHDEDDHTLLQH